MQKGPGPRGLLLLRLGFWQLGRPSQLQASSGESPRGNPQSLALGKDGVIGPAFQGYVQTKSPLVFYSPRLAESERPMEATNVPLQFTVEMGTVRLRVVRPHGDRAGDCDV